MTDDASHRYLHGIQTVYVKKNGVFLLYITVVLEYYMYTVFIILVRIVTSLVSYS